jgi:DNA-binding GntR family transcriptional regulator
MLVIMMALPVLPSGVAKAATAKPTLSTTAKTIVGTDATFTVNLINAGSNDLLLLLRQIHYDKEGTPVIYSMDYFNPEVFKFKINRIR